MILKSIILGLDPGTTTAFAALDLNGRIIRIFSKKDLGQQDLVSAVSTVGKPLLIGVDKSKEPRAAEKLAATFSSLSAIPSKYNLSPVVVTPAASTIIDIAEPLVREVFVTVT